MCPNQEVTDNSNTQPQFLESDLISNLNRIQECLGYSTDLIIQKLPVDKSQIAFLYMRGLVDDKQIKEIIQTAKKVCIQIPLAKNSFHLFNEIITIGDTKEQWDFKKIIYSLLSGKLVVLESGRNSALTVDTCGGDSRDVMESKSQTVIRGPKDSFVESIHTNQALIRRRLKSPNLHVKTLHIGNVSNTTVSMMYLDGIADPTLVEEVNRKLKNIEIDGVLESGYIESFIEDKTFSPFPTVLSSERPDIVTGNLLEGKVAILTDQTPYVLMVPATFFSFFQSIEDYAQRYDISTFIRVLRYIIFLVSLITPALYIALMTYHPEMLPTPLTINLSAQREGVPFPTVIEAILMEIVMETLREAGIRSPSPLSVMISIVGAIVIGDVAIVAGIVSPVMVMVVATTAIASFATPHYSLAISARLIRFGLMLLAAAFGLYGITIGMIFLTVHMNTLRSFGTPYLAPFAPFRLRDQKDTIFRAPLWALNYRPQSILNKLELRIPKGQKPVPSVSRAEGNEKDE